MDTPAYKKMNHGKQNLLPTYKSHLPVRTSHTLTVWSKEPVIILWPVVLKFKLTISAASSDKLDKLCKPQKV